MSLSFNDVLWISGLLLLLGIVVNKPSKRFGVPGLLIYLSLGIFLGNGGAYGFVFDYPDFTLKYSQVAISLIIFIGGMETDIKRFKPVFAEGAVLSTVGVLLCSLVVGAAGWLLFDLGWLEAWLLGAVVSSTDAAAVFSILQANRLHLKQSISELLEFESGTNDPMAYFLTITLTAALLGNPSSWLSASGEFALGILIGLVLGYLIGRGALLVSEHLRLDIKGLYPLILLSAAFITMGVAEYARANVLLSLYAAGITVGNGHLSMRSYSISFFESVAWLMEISLFVILGLQVFPHEMLPHWFTAIALCAVLILLGRPIGVFASLWPFKASRRKKIFVSWVGLRGATPIVFSLVPLVAGVRHSDLIFNVVFLIVIFSTLVQGTTIGWMARKLKLVNEQA